MIGHDIEGEHKDISVIRIVSSISDAADVSVRLAAVGFGRGIRRVGAWFGITFVIEHTDAGAIIVGSVGVTFDAEAMRGITEAPSLSVELICVAHLVLDPCLVVGGFIILEERGFRRGRVFNFIRPVIIIGLIVYGGVRTCGWNDLARDGDRYYQRSC